MGLKSNAIQSATTINQGRCTKIPSRVTVNAKKPAEKTPIKASDKPASDKQAARANTTKSLITKSVQPKKEAPKAKATTPKAFRSYVSCGPRMGKRRNSNGQDFDYHLSNEEMQFLGNFKRPMKEVPAHERHVLTQGQRETYLNMRYTYAPDDKYNFPEATSWRIGWFHKNNVQSCHNIMQTNVPATTQQKASK